MKFEVIMEPFPHIIGTDVWDDEELELIWQELNYFTKPGKLRNPVDYGAVSGKTTSKAIALSDVFKENYMDMSNIVSLQPNLLKKLGPYLDKWSRSHYSLYDIRSAKKTYYKIRYYHDGEGYVGHTDSVFSYLIFMYIHKEPKKFSGGELYFEDFGTEFSCDHNSLIVLPSYVKHGVRTVSIDDQNYHAGNGRYAITLFLDYHRNRGKK